MPLYKGDDFDPSIIPSKLKRDARVTIEFAAVLGWSIHITTSESVTIVSHDERKKYHFGRSRTTTPLNRIRRDIVRFAEPAALERAIRLQELPDYALEYLSHLSLETAEVVDDRPDAPEPEQEPEPTKPVEPSSVLNTVPVIVSERPMVAKGGEDRGYDSVTTTERKWSDGSTDYVCTRCDYQSHKRSSVPRHYGATHTRGQGTSPVPPIYVTEVPDADHYRPRRTRIEALAAVLEQIYDPEAVDWAALAEQALTWVHTQTKHSTDHAEEHEPRTPEETLERIRMLLDDGGYHRLRQEADGHVQRIVELERSVVEAEERAREAEKAVETMKYNLAAAGELLADLGQSVAAQKVAETA